MALCQSSTYNLLITTNSLFCLGDGWRHPADGAGGPHPTNSHYTSPREELGIHQSATVHQLSHPLSRHTLQHLVLQELRELRYDPVRETLIQVFGFTFRGLGV